ncbi:MAG: SCO family protein [Candidatus Eremiobacteraeota bacterium]|nr:SCO family protein [Candidatus Eremiobacteraeota bacterium]
MLTLSLDPEHDTSRDMRQIATTFGADPRFWIVGSGSKNDIRALMHRFNVTSSRGNRQYDDIHTTFVYMIDKHGHIVKTMMASTNLPADLFAELQRTWNKLNV